VTEIKEQEAPWRSRFLEALVRTLLALGLHDDAAQVLDRIDSAIARLGLPVPGALAHRAHAHLLLATGDPVRAAQHAREAAANADRAGAVIEAALSRMLAGQALAAAGDDDTAAREIYSPTTSSLHTTPPATVITPPAAFEPWATASLGPPAPEHHATRPRSPGASTRSPSSLPTGSPTSRSHTSSTSAPRRSRCTSPTPSRSSASLDEPRSSACWATQTVTDVLPDTTRDGLLITTSARDRRKRSLRTDGSPTNSLSRA